MKLYKWKDIKTMRKFENLKPTKKVKRIIYNVLNFFKYDIIRPVSNVWYWIRTHTYNRYHIINIKTKDVYDYGWIDRDSAMFLACFKLLEEYIEKEHPFEVLDWSWDEEHQKAFEELNFLYNWWKKDYPVIHGKMFFDEMYDLEDKMLKRLIEVRGFMWT